MIGQRFGRLLVVSYVGRINRHQYWLCACDCGKQHRAHAANLRCGNVQSCGCLRHDTRPNLRHGQSKSPTWAIWNGMIARCACPTADTYRLYGGRGIRVCDRWSGEDGFENFLTDMGERPSSAHSLDRYPNNDGNYEPDNCRWATVKQQGRNRRTNRLLTHDGETLCLADWADRAGMEHATLARRLCTMPLARALSLPVKPSPIRGMRRP